MTDPMPSEQPHARRFCGAKTRGGTPCQQRAMANGRCRMHGGGSLKGIAAPAFKDGKHSKYLPARLLARYHEALADPELLALREDIALLESRLSDLLRRVDTGESSHLWRQLQATHAALLEARGANDMAQVAVKLNELGTLITQGLADYAAWEDVRRVVEQRRRLVESERKRLVEMQQVMTAESAMVFVAAVAESVRKHVKDRDTLAAISGDLTRVLLTEARRAPQSADG